MRTLFTAMLLLPLFSGAGSAQQAARLPTGSIESTDQAWHDGWEPYVFGNLEMRPNVWPDQGVWVDSAAYANAPPALGDVVVVVDPDGELQMRRVVGLSGDSIGFTDGKPTRNGKPLGVGPSTLCQTEDGEKLPCTLDRVGKRSFSVEYSAFRPVREYMPVRVPEGHVYVLADHRDGVRDSRAYGTLPTRSLIGRVERVSRCVPASPTAAQPPHGARSELADSGVWLELPAELGEKRGADGSLLWTGEGVTIGVRSLPLGVRGLARHFRKLAAEGGGEATRGTEHDFAGQCGFVIEGKLKLPGGEFHSLWALVGDLQRSVMINATYPAAGAARWKKRLQAVLRAAHWAPGAP